jgi:oligoribonuclease NrnB/cAMP/cGMP phosphodiesterase (DHH superfamily)
MWAEQGRAYFAQGGHWNARGHAVAAEEIARFLQDTKRLACGPAPP